jgi:hypothetical protein
MQRDYGTFLVGALSWGLNVTEESHRSQELTNSNMVKDARFERTPKNDKNFY